MEFYSLERRRYKNDKPMVFLIRVGIANSVRILRLYSTIPAQGDLCITPVYLLEEAIFSVIPVKTGI